METKGKLLTNEDYFLLGVVHEKLKHHTDVEVINLDPKEYQLKDSIVAQYFFRAIKSNKTKKRYTNEFT